MLTKSPKCPHTYIVYSKTETHGFWICRICKAIISKLILEEPETNKKPKQLELF